ncbi:hypothetical protein BH10CYA1_BH10CYA1_60530 [soil metagenome]
MTFTKIAGNEPTFLTKDASYPAFTFFFRIHAGSEKQIHDAARLRSCCHETIKDAGLELSLCERLQDSADRLIDALESKSGAKSVGLFISQNTAHSDLYYVNVAERQYTGEFFSGYESLYAMQESHPYLLFLLEPTTVTVFTGQGTHLKTLPQSDSLNHLIAVCKRRSPVHADKDGKVRPGHEYDPKWKIELAEALSAVCAYERLPAFIVGLSMAGFDELFLQAQNMRILGTVKDVHRSSDFDRLETLVEQLLQRSAEQKAQELANLCSTASGAQKLACGLDEMLSCAKEGRADVLVIESPGWNTDAKIELSSLHQTIRETLMKHGKVEFVPPGTLAQFQGAAMILRY